MIYLQAFGVILGMTFAYLIGLVLKDIIKRIKSGIDRDNEPKRGNQWKS